MAAYTQVSCPSVPVRVVQAPTAGILKCSCCQAGRREEDLGLGIQLHAIVRSIRESPKGRDDDQLRSLCNELPECFWESQVPTYEQADFPKCRVEGLMMIRSI
jgi:hypothetical protein